MGTDVCVGGSLTGRPPVACWSGVGVVTVVAVVDADWAECREDLPIAWVRKCDKMDGMAFFLKVHDYEFAYIRQT